MKPLTDEESLKHFDEEKCHICHEEFCNDPNDKSNYNLFKKVRDHCHYTGKYRGAAHCICNLRYKAQGHIPVIVHNKSKYDFHLIIKEIAIEFKGSIECLRENTGKYISFSITIKKEHKNGKPVIYRLKFIDSYRLINRSLDTLVDKLSEIKNKSCKKCEEQFDKFSPGTFNNLKNDHLQFKYLEYDDFSYRSIHDLIKTSSNTDRFCNENKEKFILL